MSRVLNAKIDEALYPLIVGAYVAGATSTEIGSDFGISPATVCRILEKQDVTRRSVGAPRQRIPFKIIYLRAHGLTHSKIAEHYGVTKEIVSHTLKKAEAWEPSAILELKPKALEIYRKAVDEIGLKHPEALELANEQRSRQRRVQRGGPDHGAR